MSEYYFTSSSAQSWGYRDRRKPKAGTMPYSYFKCLQGSFIVHSTIGSTVHFSPLNSLEHCIRTTTMTNIRPDRGRPVYVVKYTINYTIIFNTVDIQINFSPVFLKICLCTSATLEHDDDYFFLNVCCNETIYRCKHET